MIGFYLKVRESIHIILYLEKLRSRKKEVSLLSAAQIINRRAWVRVLIPSCEAGPKFYSIPLESMPKSQDQGGLREAFTSSANFEETLR